MDYKIYEADGRVRIDLPQEFSPLKILLLSDVQGTKGDIWLESIHDVLNGESELEEVEGNSTTLEVRKDKSIITDNYAIEGIVDVCEIDTVTLVDVIENWVRTNCANKK